MGTGKHADEVRALASQGAVPVEFTPPPPLSYVTLRVIVPQRKAGERLKDDLRLAEFVKEVLETRLHQRGIVVELVLGKDALTTDRAGGAFDAKR